ncbi:MAG TPA: hypothetical protein VKB02_03255 [Pyrinomonadaceae bacterium]|nr:hypothetical protein [Pyrinomonadaceae bacterium]
MPKDATKNVDRYKIRGGHLNEFEYTERQKALAEKKPKGAAKRIPGTPPEEKSDGAQPAVKAKASKAAKSTKSTKKKAKDTSSKGASAKKLAARKAAAKK